MPVVNKTAAEIAARAETIRLLAKLQLLQPDFVSANVAFDDASANIVAEGYYALSEAYKRVRLKSTSRSNWSKAAALTAVTIGIVKPIRAAGPAIQSQWPYLNPAFGLYAAVSLSQQVFNVGDFDEQRRFFQALDKARLPCLDPIIMEGNVNGGQFKTVWDIEISDAELSFLDLLVSHVVTLTK